MPPPNNNDTERTGCLGRSQVVCLEGDDDYDHLDRRTVTWQVFLDGQLLGNAYSEEEAYRWIEDMLKLERNRR